MSVSVLDQKTAMLAPIKAKAMVGRKPGLDSYLQTCKTVKGNGADSGRFEIRRRWRRIALWVLRNRGDPLAQALPLGFIAPRVKPDTSHRTPPRTRRMPYANNSFTTNRVPHACGFAGVPRSLRYRSRECKTGQESRLTKESNITLNRRRLRRASHGKSMHTQLVVLGGGPGELRRRVSGRRPGMEVTLIDSDPRLGGTCLLRGLHPSKALFAR